MSENLQQLIQAIEALPAPQRERCIQHFLDELETGFAEEDALWESAFATDESRQWLERMADQAREESAAGRTRPVSDLFERFPDV